jgi:hypothetical protein
MKRRTLLKLLSLLPFAGPVIAKALAKSDHKLAQTYVPYLPRDFPKWNKAIDGLEDAGKWTLDIERSGLPPGTVFPRVGQIWEAVQDCEVQFRARFSQPRPQIVTTGFPKVPSLMFSAPKLDLFLRALQGRKAQLRQGEKIRILAVDDAKPLHVTFQPLRHQELHQGIVPEDIRRLPGYLGYELCLKTAKTIADFGKDNCQTYFDQAFKLSTL